MLRLLAAVAQFRKASNRWGLTMEISLFLQRLPGGRALNTAKDRLLAKSAKTHFNKLIRRYGTMLDFHLNTADRSLAVHQHACCDIDFYHLAGHG